MKPLLSPQEKQILKVLLEHDYPLTTTQVARFAHISWNTAIKYLEDFYRKGWIAQVRRGNRSYWRARR
jgi:predicted transcriptional regulator